MPPSPTPPAIGTAVLLDRRHHRVEHHAGQFLQSRLQNGRDRRQPCPSPAGWHRRCRPSRDNSDPGYDGRSGSSMSIPSSTLFVGADMGKGRIAAQHLAVAHIHHAAADRIAKLKPDFVKSLEQWPRPRQAHGRCLARFITQGNGLEPAELIKSRRRHQNAMIRQGGFALADQFATRVPPPRVVWSVA